MMPVITGLFAEFDCGTAVVSTVSLLPLQEPIKMGNQKINSRHLRIVSVPMVVVKGVLTITSAEMLKGHQAGKTIFNLNPESDY